MNAARQRISAAHLKFGLVFFTVTALYSFVGVLQAIWLSATPNFPQARAMRDFEIWAAATLVSLALWICCALMLWKRSRRARPAT
jgi:hypothetical protein